MCVLSSFLLINAMPAQKMAYTEEKYNKITIFNISSTYIYVCVCVIVADYI